MKTSILFLLALLASNSLSSFGQDSLPIVTNNQLRPGNSWVWIYYTNGQIDAPYSYEKYTVEKVERSKVTLILSSRFAPNEPFQPRQKFIVDLAKCHQAYSQRNSPRGWMLESFYRSENSWVSLGHTQRTAIFEEKFNCNPHVYGPLPPGRYPPIETHYKKIPHPLWGTLDTFAQVRKLGNNLAHSASWYSLNDGDLSGVTVYKEFNPGTEHSYVMRLEEHQEAP